MSISTAIFQTFAVFRPQMAKYDAAKKNLKKTFVWFFLSLDGRRQIGDKEGTESFMSISTGIFELSRKSGRGQKIAPAECGLTHDCQGS